MWAEDGKNFRNRVREASRGEYSRIFLKQLKDKLDLDVHARTVSRIILIHVGS